MSDAKRKPRRVMRQPGLLNQIDRRRAIASADTSNPQVDQPIRAELVGTATCAACGITARGNTPVLALCRLLIAAGHNPASPLEAWRGDVLCLKAPSIGAAARLTIDESRVRFARWKPFSSAAVSPQIAQNRKAAIPTMTIEERRP